MGPKIVAIDPGASGGIASISRSGVIELFKMPDTEEGVCDLLRNLTPLESPPKVYMELVGGYVAGRPAPGSRMFNFGRGFGFMLGVLMDRGIDATLVTPQVWQKKFQVTGKGQERKKALKAKALERYPTLKKQITLKTCDALLLLDYAQHHQLIQSVLR